MSRAATGSGTANDASVSTEEQDRPSEKDIRAEQIARMERKVEKDEQALVDAKAALAQLKKEK